MKRYSVFAIAKEALNYHLGWEKAWASPAPKKEYDAIIVGAGGHGLATAYYLGKNFGITNVAVAARLGCVPETIRRWRLPFGDSDRRIPDETAMAPIFEFTQGEVPPASFYQMGAPVMDVLA